MGTGLRFAWRKSVIAVLIGFLTMHGAVAEDGPPEPRPVPFTRANHSIGLGMGHAARIFHHTQGVCANRALLPPAPPASTGRFRECLSCTFLQHAVHLCRDTESDQIAEDKRLAEARNQEPPPLFGRTGSRLTTEAYIEERCEDMGRRLYCDVTRALTGITGLAAGSTPTPTPTPAPNAPRQPQQARVIDVSTPYASLDCNTMPPFDGDPGQWTYWINRSERDAEQRHGEFLRETGLAKIETPDQWATFLRTECQVPVVTERRPRRNVGFNDNATARGAGARKNPLEQSGGSEDHL